MNLVEDRTASAECGTFSWNESDRLAALEQYAILDTGREPGFDDIAELAADIFDAPIAVVNFIAADRQWFKAEKGIGTDTLPLDVSICRHAILQPGLLVVPDLTQDERFDANPLIHAADGLRFYAGALLETPEGLPLGTLCVLDTKARPDGISPRQERALATLASQTMAQLELRRSHVATKGEGERRAFLLNLSDRTRRMSDAHAIVAATTCALGEQLGAARVAYVEIDDGQDLATTVGGWTDGVTLPLPAKMRVSDFSGPIIEHLRAGTTLRISDTYSDPVTMGNLAALDAITARAIVSVPLLKNGNLYGNLNVHYSIPHDWTDAEVELVEAVAERTWEAVERAKTEKALRELNEILEHKVLDIAADRERAWRVSQELLTTVNEDGTFAEINDAWNTLLGWSAGEIVGRHFGELAHPDDLAATQSAFETVFDAPLTVPFEYRLRHKNGEYRWFSWTAVYEHGRIYGSGRDVNAEREAGAAIDLAEAARREADALYRAYFENTPEALFVISVETDGNFLVEEINPAHEAGVGLKIDDIRGKKIEDVLPSQAARRVIEAYRHVIETDAIFQYREMFDLGGMAQHWDTSLVPVRNEEGRVARIIGASRNVTRQVVAEEALRQSQKMEAMGQLTGGVAHDFNNLLTPIFGSLDMLQRKGLGGEREQRLIAGAMQSAERAKTLVQRLLAFARRQPLQAVPVDVAGLVIGMGDLIASTTGPQIEVTVNAPDSIPSANADPNQLEMALLNLAVNARDAMPDGGALDISVSVQSVGAGHVSGLDPDTYIRLAVTDTGIGMDEQTLARAVEPFFSTKGVGKGTGLGLSMVHGLASQLGGALTVKSKPGSGTSIELWLPQSDEAPAAKTAPPELLPDTKARGTVLLVDDEELGRLSTADMLGDLGYNVLEAGSGEHALAMIKGGQDFDVLITDHLMPGMTGTQLASAARSIKSGCPVLLVSGYAELNGIDPALPRLTKPFRTDELASSLAQLN